MQVEIIAECSEHSAILSTFINLHHGFKTLLLSFVEWPFYTGFTVVEDFDQRCDLIVAKWNENTLKCQNILYKVNAYE